MHWHAAGLGAYANMRFPQWAFSHRPCARSGRTRSKSSWWRRTGPIGRGSQNWCSSQQPLLGKFLWGGISFLSGLPPAVVNTITSARALSTRQAYRLKWNLFVDWCSPCREDPRRCPIAVVLSFLQDGLEWRLSPSTLKVYVAAIAAHHDAVDGTSLGKHDLVIRFLRGARRLNHPRPHLVPSWDLPSVLSALRGAPFEPLQSVELNFLSLKTVLLAALATAKRVGDLQAFSVDDSCLELRPGNSNQITFIVTSPKHKCLGEWNSYERAPDSAEKQQTIYLWTDSAKKTTNNLHMDRQCKKNNRQFTYGQTVQKNNKQFTYGQTVQKKQQTIYIWTDSAKKTTNNLHMDRQCKKTALEHLQCSRQCKKKKKKKKNNLHMDRQCKKTTAIYIWTVHIYRLYRRQCAKYTYIYSVRLVYYKDILNYQRHIIHRMGTSTLCTVSIHNVVYT